MMIPDWTAIATSQVPRLRARLGQGDDHAVRAKLGPAAAGAAEEGSAGQPVRVILALGQPGTQEFEGWRTWPRRRVN